MLKSELLRNEGETDHTENYRQSSDGLKLYSQRWIPGSKIKAIITLIHGLGDHSGRYELWARNLASQGFMVNAMDLRGHGLSEGKRGYTSSYQKMIRDIQEFLDLILKEYPNLPHFLYGHSFGGNLVLNFAIQQTLTIRGLIITSPWLELKDKPGRWRLLMASISSIFLPWMTTKTGIRAEDISRDLRITHLYRTDPLVHDRIGVRLGLQTYEAGIRASRSIYKINVPMLVMHGEADNLTSCKATRDFVRNSSEKTSYIEWEGGFHELHNDIEKENVFEKLLEWLNKHIS